MHAETTVRRTCNRCSQDKRRETLPRSKQLFDRCITTSSACVSRRQWDFLRATLHRQQMDGRRHRKIWSSVINDSITVARLPFERHTSLVRSSQMFSARERNKETLEIKQNLSTVDKYRENQPKRNAAHKWTEQKKNKKKKKSTLTNKCSYERRRTNTIYKIEFEQKKNTQTHTKETRNWS